MATSTLQAGDWTRAALAAIADGGLAAVRIERLAPGLGASKGSFYWHFDDRAALVDAAVARWEETRTEAVIRALATVDDPRERLRRVFAGAFGDLAGTRLDAAMAAHAEDPAVGPALRRVTERRIGFMTSALRELGLPPARARDRALTAYAAFLGLPAVRAASPALVPTSPRRLAAYLDDLLDVMTRPMTPASPAAAASES